MPVCLRNANVVLAHRRELVHAETVRSSFCASSRLRLEASRTGAGAIENSSKKSENLKKSEKSSSDMSEIENERLRGLRHLESQHPVTHRHHERPDLARGRVLAHLAEERVHGRRVCCGLFRPM